MQSILEEDLADRLPDEAYSASLRRHLAGRKIEQVSAEEVARIDAETGWGRCASEAALAMMIREESRKRSIAAGRWVADPGNAGRGLRQRRPRNRPMRPIRLAVSG